MKINFQFEKFRVTHIYSNKFLISFELSKYSSYSNINVFSIKYLFELYARST